VSDFRTLTLADALAVAGAMREWDRRCVRAMLGDDDAESFAVNRWQTDGPAWVLDQDGAPVLVCGLSWQNSWTAAFWLIATDHVAGQSWRKLIRGTRTVIANVTDPAHEHYRHRVEAYTLGGWTAAEALVERLGFTRESVRRGSGAGGEDLHCWVIVGQPKERQ
jgi:RimJ/RimL family protein N-acetyltransferase